MKNFFQKSMQLDFGEIQDHSKFEDLAVAYFEGLKNEKEKNLVTIELRPSGIGTDGGRDILLSLQVTDGIAPFYRRWVVQCKFYKKSISTDIISDINIPTLIHSYKASGYLLICRKKPTSKLTDLFERLETNCDRNNKYIIWDEEQFTRLILAQSDSNILRQFFPKYFEYCVRKGIIKL